MSLASAFKVTSALAVIFAPAAGAVSVTLAALFCDIALFKTVTRVECFGLRDSAFHGAVVAVLLLGAVPERNSAKVNVAVIAPFGEVALTIADVAVFVAHVSLGVCAVTVCACDKEAVVIDVLVVQMNLRAVVFTGDFRDATVSVVPVVVGVS